MSRPVGSTNQQEVPAIIQADETERIEYLASLLLEIIEEEFQEGEEICSQT